MDYFSIFVWNILKKICTKIFWQNCKIRYGIYIPIFLKPGVIIPRISDEFCKILKIEQASKQKSLFA